MIGQTISHYRILEKLGEGGMGIVYKAEDTKLKRTVALKFLPREALASQEAKARLMHEAQAAAALDHPGICTVHEIDDAEGQTFIAMAHIEGQSLRERIASRPLALTDALDIAIQTAEGLHHAHEKGIVHRDIKPSNVMLSSGGQVKIMDFGLARSAEQTQLTQAGATLGTVAYMSPEQARGESVDHRADIWAFGVMLYEMVVGQLPFKGEHEQAVLYSVLNEESEPMTGLRSGVPLELERIVTKAMAKTPKERYQHMDEMLVDLRTLRKRLRGEAATPPTGSLALDAATRVKTRRPWIIAGLFAVAVAVGVVVLTRLWDRGLDVDPSRVVVAAFENRTGDASLNFVGQMVADWITQGLSRVDAVKVVPTMSTMEYARAAGTGADRHQEAGQLRTLAKLTGAGIVVSGAFYADGENLRFQTRVTDVEQGELIHALPAIGGPRDAPMESIEMLRQQVMAAVASHLTGSPIVGEGTQPPTYEAYREHMLGMELFGSDYPQAVRHFERAAELDSSFLPPRIFIIYSYSNQGRRAEADSIFRILDGNRQHLSRYERLYLDFLGALLRNDHAESLRFLRQLEKLTPNTGSIKYLIGLTAIRVNRPQEAVHVFTESRIRDHVGGRSYHVWGFYAWANALHMLGEHRKELEVIRQAREFFPDNEYLRLYELLALVALGRLDEVNRVIDECKTLSDAREFQCLVVSRVAGELRVHGHWDASSKLVDRAAQLHEELGREESPSESDRSYVAGMLYSVECWEQARVLFERLSSDNPDDIDYTGYLGCLAARRGDREAAARISAQLRQVKRPYLFGENTYWCACIAAQLGERERAMELLREAFAQGYEFGAGLHRDMDLQPLWGYPPFEDLIRPKG
jgi:tRNA A-37 threonylcarbamoyl transferase component Bud32/tetratricopeptide (TPR) repeat protein